MRPELYRLSIETSNLCNLRCIMCLHHNPNLYRGQADHHPKLIDFDFYKSIVDQFKAMNSYLKFLSPHFQGEPLIYPKFIDACDYLEKKNILFGFTTNGMLLEKEITDMLLSMRMFHSISFSVDGLTKETLEKIRIGIDYEKLMLNIDYFLTQYRKKPHPVRVTVNFVKMEENMHEFDAFVKHWLDRGISVTASYCTDEIGIPKKMDWFPEERLPCYSLESFAVVLTNGDVVPCCNDHFYELVMGNLHEKSLREIWEGEAYQELRKAHKNTFEKIPEVCKRCYTWMTDYTKNFCRIKLKTSIVHLQYPFWEEYIKVI